MYRISEPDALRGSWGSYWGQLYRRRDSEPEFGAPPDPYAEMPFLRYEVTLRSYEKGYDLYRDMAGDERSWFRIERDPTSPVVAEVYGNVFGAPRQANVRARRVDKDTAKALSAIFDMDAWPDASEQQIGQALELVAQHAAALVAFDIGQGSASALLDEGQVPFVYHDLGAGITNNARTTPVPLKFCWTRNPVVVLSHWDKDHWAGALKDRDAMIRTWIVPRQIISVGHAAFGSDILRAGGRILVWSSQQPCIPVPIGSRQSMTVGRCTGKDRNGSCLVIRVDDENHGELRHWLLTGDGGYDQLPFALPGRTVAMTVPHHGAKMAVNGSVPAGPGHAYGRVLYSFGPGNKFSSTTHPTRASVSEHENAGWTVGSWHSTSQPGMTLAGGDVLATAQHASSHLGGAVAAWDAPPLPLPRPCQGSAVLHPCSTEIKQS
jgi:beta-lactamase superfamily II metal-dependent hydrolase